LGIECRQGDQEILGILKVLEDADSRDCCLAERAFLRQLEGGCQVPIGVNTRLEGDNLILTGMVASLDGQKLIKDQLSAPRSEAERLGQDLALRLRDQGAGEILAEILAEVGRG
jgi:hydroxymethylbilane synthase